MMRVIIFLIRVVMMRVIVMRVIVMRVRVMMMIQNRSWSFGTTIYPWIDYHPFLPHTTPEAFENAHVILRQGTSQEGRLAITIIAVAFKRVDMTGVRIASVVIITIGNLVLRLAARMAIKKIGIGSNIGAFRRASPYERLVNDYLQNTSFLIAAITGLSADCRIDVIWIIKVCAIRRLVAIATISIANTSNSGAIISIIHWTITWMISTITSISTTIQIISSFFTILFIITSSIKTIAPCITRRMALHRATTIIKHDKITIIIITMTMTMTNILILIVITIITNIITTIIIIISVIATTTTTNRMNRDVVIITIIINNTTIGTLATTRIRVIIKFVLLNRLQILRFHRIDFAAIMNSSIATK
mmetsp:Transcript_15525/g.27713  ORF Transcript_15525/g.27713 Transcript_15525/m.27713 type:complete len:362 (+) Transcript_15525:286-1371(+)